MLEMSWVKNWIKHNALTNDSDCGLNGAPQMAIDIDVFHPKLFNRFEYMLRHMMYKMVEHATPILTHDEAHALFATPRQAHILRQAGKIMQKSNVEYSYNLADNLGVQVICHGNDDLPSVLMPEYIWNIPELLELLKPLSKINYDWTTLLAAYRKMPELMDNTRELNVYFPWLRLLLPRSLIQASKDMHKGLDVIAEWVGGVDRETDKRRVKRQFDIIRSGSRPSSFTWFPRDLVRIATMGSILITQYNLLKDVPIKPKPDGYVELNILTAADVNVDALIAKAKNSLFDSAFAAQQGREAYRD